MEVIDNYNISSSSQSIYYVSVIIIILLALVKQNFNRYVLFINIVFLSGLFDYLASINLISENVYKIGILMLSIIIFWRFLFQRKSKDLFLLNFVFFLFSISYWLSFLLNPINPLTALSQYGLKYLFPFVIFHGFRGMQNDFYKSEFISIANSLYIVLLVQILLSIIKVITFNGLVEFVVGSIQHIGGGTAVTLPILGLLTIFLLKKGNLKTNDWLIASLLLFIAIASTKRTPVFIFPIFVFLLSVYIKKRVKFVSILMYLPFVFLLLYIGVRTNYTLNPESSSWGSFDLEYAYKYVLKYNFGTESLLTMPDYTEGRGGSLLLLLHPERLGLTNSTKLLFGNGLEDFAYAAKGRFMGGVEYGIKHEGLMGYATIEFYKLGIVGFTLYTVFVFTLLSQIRMRKFKLILTLWIIIDFFLYYNSSLSNPSMIILTMFIISFSNNVFEKKSFVENYT